MDTSDSQRRKSRAAALSVVSNATLVVFKIVVGLLTGSVSVLSEAVHSGVDLMAAIVAFVAVKKSGKPADEEHPFGHTKLEDVSAGIEAILIFLAAGWIIFEALRKLVYPDPLDRVGWGVTIMLVSAIANLGVSRLLFKVGKETDSAALIADGWHLRTDVFTSAGVMAGLGLIWAGSVFVPALNLNWLDPAAAIVVAFLILRAAYRLTKGSVRELVDTSLPPEEIEWLNRYLCSLRPTVRAFHEVRTRKAGAIRFVDLHLLVDSHMSVKESHDITERVSRDVEVRFPGASVTVHVEPCEVECTPQCSDDCLLTGDEQKSLRTDEESIEKKS